MQKLWKYKLKNPTATSNFARLEFASWLETWKITQNDNNYFLTVTLHASEMALEKEFET